MRHDDTQGHWPSSTGTHLKEPLIDQPRREHTAYGPSSRFFFHHSPWLRSLWYIVSNENINFCIQRWHSNMGQVGPVIYIFLWRHLLTWHWHILPGEYNRQRNKHRIVETTNLQVGYSKTRGWHAVSIKCCEIDGGPLTTHTQVPHEMLCHESVTASRV